MKKCMVYLMVLVLALTGAAFAEPLVTPVTLEQPALVASDSLVLVEIIGADSSLSYILLGTGGGLDVFSDFAVDMNDYEEGFERVWKFLSSMTPNVTVSAGDSLVFGAMNDSVPGTTYTEVSINGEVVAQLSGLEVFGILSGNGAGIVPVINDLCSVVIWTENGNAAYPANGAQVTGLCANCGAIDTGSDEHDTLISRYCKDEHTVCMGEPMHFCEGCEQEYPCAKSGSHTECAVCGELWCYKEKGDHKELDCGHRGCEVFGHETEHAKCSVCGEYLCKGTHEHPETEDDDLWEPEADGEFGE